MAYQLLLWAVIICISLLLLFWKFVFLRDPERDIPAGKNILCPADGTVNKILKVDKKSFELRKGALGRFLAVSGDVSDRVTVVSIVMRLSNVHVQRAPIGGKVTYIKHTPGKFRNAVTDHIVAENERNEMLITDGRIKLKVIQIAGFLARRIECFVKNGQVVKPGQRIGRIILGSQVSLILPAKLNVKVREGEKVRAGETIIAGYK